MGAIGRAAIGALLLSAGCASQSETDTGAIQIALDDVPDGISCLRIAVVSSRTVVKLQALHAHQPSVFSMTALPVGPATFSAEAFASACPFVLSTDIAEWIGDEVGA